MIAVKEWLTGTSAPVGATDILLIVETDGPGTVQFAHVSGQALNGIPATPVQIQAVGTASNLRYYAEVQNVSVSDLTTPGSSSVISATPIDEASSSGTAVDLTLTYEKYSPLSGNRTYTDGDVLITPTDKDVAGSYWRVYMKAEKDAGGNIAGAMVRFSVSPSNNVQVWSDETTPTQLQPLNNYYYVMTRATDGEGAVRIVTNDKVFNQVITCDVSMNGVMQFRPAIGYFANYNDPQNANSDWTPPIAQQLDPHDNNIRIPETGDQCTLNVSVNGNTDAGYVRYIVMDNTMVIPYNPTTDGTVQVYYSTLIQDPNPESNHFTYVQFTPTDGNVQCSLPWAVGVDGNAANLPRDSSKPRVAPIPVVTPDPGADRIIGLGTLATHDGLRLALQNFPLSALTGYANGTLTVVFRYYMNGYMQNGNLRPPYVYDTDKDAVKFTTIPTIKVTGSTVEFTPNYVELSSDAAKNWGRNPFGDHDKKKVGFEYVITEGTGPSAVSWYSNWNGLYDFYRISTGNW